MLVCPLLNIKPKMTTPILKAPKLDNDVIEPVASSGFSIGKEINKIYRLKN